MNEDQVKKRHPKIEEAIKALQPDLETIFQDLESKYHLKTNIQDINYIFKETVEKNCSSLLEKVKLYSSNVSNFHSEEPPKPIPGKEIEFKQSLAILKSCTSRYEEKIVAFEGTTQMLSAFYLTSMNYCVNDCEDQVLTKEDTDPTPCIRDCFQAFKYNNISFAKVIENAKNNLGSELL